MSGTRIAAGFAVLIGLVSMAGIASGQEVRLTGRVTEARSGTPLSGARVTASGAADTTRADGRYALTITRAGQTVAVRVTRIGFAPAQRTVTIGQRSSAGLDFELEPHTMDLDAVVITGSAGPAPVRSVGHSITSLKVSDVPEPIVSVDHLITSKLPGLITTPGSGLAGSGSKIRLRGGSSVALSNQPLVYVDGVRVRSDGYPKNVPLIGERFFSSNDTPSPLNDINPADIERVEIVRGPAAATLYGTEAATGVIQIFTRRGAPGRTVWNSQIDGGFSHVRPFGPSDEPYMRLGPWLRRAARTGASLSAAGGTDVRYHLSSSFHRAEGVLPNDLEKRFTIRGNFDLAPVKRLSLAWSSALTINDIANTAAGPNNQGLTQNAYRGPANATGIDTKESLDRILAWELSTKINHATAGLTAVLTQSSSTTHTVTVGYDRAESEMRSLRPYGYVFAPQGILANEQWISTTSTVDYLGNTRIPLSSSTTANLAWGAQSIGTNVTSLAGYAEGFAGSAPPTLSSGALTLSGESRLRAILAGAFTQATIGFRDRLFLTGGIRVDGSSSFGADFGLQTFPRASASYVISDEAFWPQRMPTLKLRTAYGQAGRAPRVFDADRTWLQAGFEGKPAYMPNSLGNSNLGPERSSEFEAGFDAASRSDRWTAGLTAYRRTTYDALLPVSHPPSLGFLNPQLENVGTLRASGLELSLSGRVGSVDRVSVRAGVDLSFNRSKAIDLGSAPGFVLESFAWIREGLPTPVVVGAKIRNPDELAEPDIDLNHVFGPNMPTKVFGLHSSVQLRGGIELAARLEYQGGSFIYDNASRPLFGQGVHPRCNDGYALMKAGKRDEMTAWQRAYCIPASLPVGSSIVSADFARLRDASLTIPLPGALMRTRAATMVFAARNYLVWNNSELDAFDPEMGGRDGMFALSRTMELTVPTPASLSVSIRAAY